MNELEINRELTRAFIELSPVTIIFTPYERVSTAANGVRFIAQPQRVEQTARFIESNANTSASPPLRTTDGEQESLSHSLIMLHDGEVEIDDRFTLDGVPWVVVRVERYNGYEIRAGVIRRG